MLQPYTLLHAACPAGQIENLYIPAQGTPRGVAIVHHPNPLQGGTFTNKVAQTTAKALAQLGFHCYLPNSRGTGNSEGAHDYGAGESDDMAALAQWAKQRHPEAPLLALAGFSFGGYVATLAAERVQPDLLLLIGAALGHYKDRTPAPSAPKPERTLLVHGAADEVVALQNVLNWAAPQNLPVLVLPEASHFLHGKLIPLRDTLLRFIPPLLEAA